MGARQWVCWSLIASGAMVVSIAFGQEHVEREHMEVRDREHRELEQRVERLEREAAEEHSLYLHRELHPDLPSIVPRLDQRPGGATGGFLFDCSDLRAQFVQQIKLIADAKQKLQELHKENADLKAQLGLRDKGHQ